jgi:hypothetical protein
MHMNADGDISVEFVTDLDRFFAFRDYQHKSEVFIDIEMAD